MSLEQQKREVAALVGMLKADRYTRREGDGACRGDSVFLVERARLARLRLNHCDLCSIECGVNRLAGEKGVCGLGDQAFWFREGIHFGIETEFAPTHSIHLTGCSMRCSYCNVMDWIERPNRGNPWDSERLARLVEQRRREGARTLHLIGGEVTVSLPAILEMLSLIDDRPPVVWDSNMLLSEAARELLDGVVDIYLGDAKFGNDACGRRIGGVAHYMERLEENLNFAERSARLIVRHLLMPGHFECCLLPLLEWLPRKVKRLQLSLRSEYMPPAVTPREARLQCYLTVDETRRAREAALAAGIELVE